MPPGCNMTMTLYGGQRPVFQCRACNIDTFDEGEARRHVLLRHAGEITRAAMSARAQAKAEESPPETEEEQE